MPTYKYQCKKCEGFFEQWHSIHAESMGHCDCGGFGTKVYESMATLGIGKSGQQFADTEARENRWHKDMPAYKRFRDKGMQPASIDGCDRLEATARNELEVKTNGRISVPDSVVRSSMADAQDIVAGRL